MTTTTLNETDPTVYLTNGTRTALLLEGPSSVPQSIVQTAQEAYYAANGIWPYVEGMPNKIPTSKTTIGTVSATGPDLTGTNLAFETGATTTVTASFDGDAKDATFKWTIRTGGSSVAINGSSTKAAVSLEGSAVGLATIRCVVTSAGSSDSPKEITISATVTDPPAAMTATVTKAPTSQADDTCDITFENKALKDRTLNYGFQQDNSGGVDSQTVSIPAGTTAVQAATLLVNSVSDPEVTASRKSAVVTFAPKSGSFINKLTCTLS